MSGGPGFGSITRSGCALTHGCTIPVLGIPVRFEANDPRPIAIAEEAFGAWRTLTSHAAELGAESLRVHIRVVPGQEGASGHAPLGHELRGPGRATITTPGSRAIADAGRRLAEIDVTEHLLGDRQHFRYGLLEAATLCMLSACDRQPVHAAAISRAGAVLLLAGPSGTGKSTLAYAAATRLGCTILGEDVVNVQMKPALRIWGLPGFVHLPPGAPRHFPELGADEPTLLANGKRKIAVSLERLGALPRVPFADHAGICILDAGDRAASLEPISPAEIICALGARSEPGFDVYADTISASIAAIAAGGGWHLRTSQQPAESIPLLDSALSMLAARAPR